MCAGITTAFHFSSLYSPVFSELFTLSKNFFDHPNARQWTYFHLVKKKTALHEFVAHFLFANNKNLI